MKKILHPFLLLVFVVSATAILLLFLNQKTTHTPKSMGGLKKEPLLDDIALCQKVDEGDVQSLETYLSMGGEAQYVSCPDGQGDLLQVAIRSKNLQYNMVHLLIKKVFDPCHEVGPATYAFDIVDMERERYQSEFEETASKEAKEKVDVLSQIYDQLTALDCSNLK